MYIGHLTDILLQLFTKAFVIFIFMFFKINMKINHSENLAFHSGFTTKIAIEEKLVNPTKIETNFMNSYNVEASFNQNKSAALANKFCADIFTKLADVTKNSYTFPPCIKLYDKKYLTDISLAENFCIPDTKEVLTNDYPFPGRSIFFKEFKKLRYVDDITEFQYKNKRTSSPHFLAPFIHEWLHSLQLDSIYNKFGYGGNCDYLNSIYPTKNQKITGFDLIKNFQTKTLTPKENEIVYDVLGEYATLPINQYFEVFSEAFTKFICASLEGVKLVKNPIDLLKMAPKEFLNILSKIIP